MEEGGSTKAIIYAMPDFADAVLHSEQKKGTEGVSFQS